MNSNWQLADIPNLSGKVFIVTGGNTGLGLKSVEHLSKRGAKVVLACRNKHSAQSAISQLNPDLIEIVELDLTNLASIKTFSEHIYRDFNQLDGLINNAGVVNLEHLSHTPDGHEMHMATNHYGHFALTGLLFDLLISTPHSRVVSVTSGAYKAGEIRFDDIDWHQRKYSRMKAYGDSKLANLLFTLELQKRFDQAKSTSIAVSAHPGLTATPRQQTIGIGGWLSKCLASDMDIGVAPQLLAATAPEVNKLDFYGPKFGIRGAPKKLMLAKNALDDSLSAELWRFTEKVTGVCY